MTPMDHRVALLPLLLAALLSRAEHPLVYTSPARFADEVAEAVFAGDDFSSFPALQVVP